jgi:hypothetical protein
MMIPKLLKPSGFVAEFEQVQATKEAFDPLERALPGAVLFRVEDNTKACEPVKGVRPESHGLWSFLFLSHLTERHITLS